MRGSGSRTCPECEQARDRKTDRPDRSWTRILATMPDRTKVQCSSRRSSATERAIYKKGARRGSAKPGLHVRVRVDGEVRELWPSRIDAQQEEVRHTIEIGRRSGGESRMGSATEADGLRRDWPWRLGRGPRWPFSTSDRDDEVTSSSARQLACLECGVSLTETCEPRTCSRSTRPHGACGRVRAASVSSSRFFDRASWSFPTPPLSLSEGRARPLAG